MGRDYYNKSKYYTEDEVKEILKSKERLVFADDGLVEVVIRKKDIPDYIVDYVNICGHSSKLKIIDNERGNCYDPTIITVGWFLEKCNSTTREEIIDRLSLLQTTEEKPNDIKIIDEHMLEGLIYELNIESEELFGCKDSVEDELEGEM